MKLFSFEFIDSFLNRYRTSLKRDEPLKHIVLGSALLLQSQNTAPEYLAAVEKKGKLLAATLLVPGGKLLLLGSDEEADPAAELLAAHLCQRATTPESMFGPSPITLALAQACRDAIGTRYEVGFVSYLHELTQLNPVSMPKGYLRVAEKEDIPLVLNWQRQFYQEALPTESADDLESAVRSAIGRGDYVIWENVEPVSMAARMRPGIRTIAVSMVYTPCDHRGKGYGRAITAALTRRLLKQGWQRCLLFTDVTNDTSNHIYKKLGYRILTQFHNLVRL